MSYMNDSGIFSDAQYDYFNKVFEARANPALLNRVSHLIPEIQINGATASIRQYKAPFKAIKASDRATLNTIKEIEFYKRRIEPENFIYPVSMTRFDLASIPDFDFVGFMARDAADGCLTALDEYMMEKIVDIVEIDNSRGIPIPDENIIPFDFGEQSKANVNKLTPEKTDRAVDIMRGYGVIGTIMCLAGDDHLTDFRQDPYVRNTDFNIQPAMATGLTAPYGRITGFMPTMFDNRLAVSVKDNSTPVDWVYVLIPEQFRKGVQLPWEFDFAKNPERGFDLTIEMKGSYGFTRLEEGAIVIIEVAHKDRVGLGKYVGNVGNPIPTNSSYRLKNLMKGGVNLKGNK